MIPALNVAVRVLGIFNITTPEPPAPPLFKVLEGLLYPPPPPPPPVFAAPAVAVTLVPVPPLPPPPAPPAPTELGLPLEI